MARWNETIDLLSAKAAWQDDEGGWHEGERDPRTVFCNPLTIGSMTLAQLRSSEVRTTSGEGSPDVGMQVAALVQVRTIDYGDEDQVLYRGKEMRVIAATAAGEKTNLYLQRVMGND
jgi:hypothetical protein